MQITETSADGLKREYKVVIPAKDIEKKVESRLQELGRTLRLPGFRPGKVPMPLLKQRYGQSVMGEVLESTVTDSSHKALHERGLRPAMQPKVEVTSFGEGGDLEYKLAVELIPDFEPVDFATIEVERIVAAVDDAAVDDALQRIADSNRTSEPVTEERAAETGDIVVIDFDGSVDGEAKPGMKGEGHELELGSGQFIDTFESQLVGAKAGDHRTVTVTFPTEYHAAELAGREAVFEVDVKELRRPKRPELNDDFAKTLGFDDLGALKTAVSERIANEYGQVSRERLKRALLDRLAERHDFPVPASMVDLEFDAIWKRVDEERKAGRLTGEDAEKSEEQLRDEYRKIAERRVRLGLLLSEVGRRNNVQISQDEINRALIAEAQRYPGSERQVLEFFKNNPRAIDNLRAPLFEDKVIDYILELAKVNERQVSIEELLREPDSEMGTAA